MLSSASERVLRGEEKPSIDCATQAAYVHRTLMRAATHVGFSIAKSSARGIVYFRTYGRVHIFEKLGFKDK